MSDRKDISFILEGVAAWQSLMIIFLKACRGEKTDYVPVWFMWQAGRSQPEYLKIKEKYSLFEITQIRSFVHG